MLCARIPVHERMRVCFLVVFLSVSLRARGCVLCACVCVPTCVRARAHFSRPSISTVLSKGMSVSSIFKNVYLQHSPITTNGRLIKV